ncbi:MAG: hypothetical protein ACR2MM_01435 [Flavobacteriaceae bacterium]
MKALSAFIVIFLYSGLIIASDNACDYAGSNIDFVRSQTQKAIAAENLQQSKYFAYKALNAIEKSKKQLQECGCEYAFKSILEGLDNLKKATRVSTLVGARILLNRALDNTMGSLDALEQHDELHKSLYASDVLALNTKATEEHRLNLIKPQGQVLEKKIDQFLEAYRKSLNKVVSSVPCKEAYSYASKVYEHCEQQLLNGKLTEAKKYYNLKTKEITAEAIKELGNCSDQL